MKRQNALGFPRNASQTKAPQVYARRVPFVQAAQAPRLMFASARQAIRSLAKTLSGRPVAAVLLCGSLAACATASEPRIITRTVEVPVSVPCAVSVTEPAYVDTDEAIAGAPNLYEIAKLYAAGRLQRIGALGEYRAAVKGCKQ